MQVVQSLQDLSQDGGYVYLTDGARLHLEGKGGERKGEEGRVEGKRGGGYVVCHFTSAGLGAILEGGEMIPSGESTCSMSFTSVRFKRYSQW